MFDNKEITEEYDVVPYQSESYKEINTVFLAIGFVFSIFNCFSVSYIWIFSRKKELEAYGYGVIQIAGLLLLDMLKLCVPATIFALIAQGVYSSISADGVMTGGIIVNKKQIVMEQLEKMGIADMKKKYPSQLSGGQQQRCAIARALAANTPVLLADEPTGALDINTGKEIIDCFEEINKQGKTVILITHDINIANRCKRIIRIEDGKIVE